MVQRESMRPTINLSRNGSFKGEGITINMARFFWHVWGTQAIAS
jgi:hypothetical protein